MLPVGPRTSGFRYTFQEKRPFFLEGKEISDSPLQPFYSRNDCRSGLRRQTDRQDRTRPRRPLRPPTNAPGNFLRKSYRNSVLTSVRNLTDYLRVPMSGMTNLWVRTPCSACSASNATSERTTTLGSFSTGRIFPMNRNFVNGFDGTFKLHRAR